MMVKLGSDLASNDLDHIQELFPTDCLLLYDRDPLSPRSKLLVRKRSTTASRFQRALSAGKNKIVPTERQGSPSEISGNGSEMMPPRTLPCPRTFITDTPVQLTTGVQSQERHFFLFNDLLIVAKARASGTYKLKEKVRVAEIWLSNCLEVVCEVAKNGDTSFVMGWPTTNVVATFSSTHTRDLWLAKLKQLIAENQQHGPQSTSIRVHHWDSNTKEEYAHNVSVSPRDTVVDCIKNALQQLGLKSNDVDGYQLWVKTDRESAPYPLIGHESPLAIKMNCLYAALAVAGEDAFDSDYARRSVNATCPVLKCYFILRSTRRGSFDLVSPKKSKRVRKSPILQKVFRRSLSKPESLNTVGTVCNQHSLFGQSLTRIVRDGALPKPIMDIFQKLCEIGPYTVGIFRKSANARLCRELREKLNSEGGAECDLSNANIFVLAALLKEFLRSLPDCLLLCCLYLEWLAICRLSSDTQKLQEVQRLLERLPSSHLLFLRHFMCVLWHVQRRSSENMMTAANLAVCVGPSLLWSSDCNSTTYTVQSEASKQVPAVVEFLIHRCEKIFGEDCLSLLGNVERRDLSRQDSGNEESDSLHSLQSSQSSVGLRRDDSSIDSLERAFLGDGEASPKLPCKAKMSLTNLSRDSGLTMSDTQLYTPDEELDSELSSSRVDVTTRNGFHAAAGHASRGGGVVRGVASTGSSGGVSNSRGGADLSTLRRHQFHGDDSWRSSTPAVAKVRSLSCSSGGGDSVCSLVDGVAGAGRQPASASSQEGKRSAIGSPSCLSPSEFRFRKQEASNIALASSAPQSCMLGSYESIRNARAETLAASYPSKLGDKARSSHLMASSEEGAGGSSRGVPKSIFPLGGRREVIKRRLSRSRAWMRPTSSYGLEQLQDDYKPVGELVMRKSASEESVLSNLSSTSPYLTYKRPAQHNKGKAPEPPTPLSYMHSMLSAQTAGVGSRQQVRPTCSVPSTATMAKMGMTRSKSMHVFHTNYDDLDVDEPEEHFLSDHSLLYCSRINNDGRGGTVAIETSSRTPSTPARTMTSSGLAASQQNREAAGNNWRISGHRSLTHLGGSGDNSNTHDFSYDSSTLSDNDSTPHISRSNSRGRDYVVVSGSGSGSASTTTSAANNSYGLYADLYAERVPNCSETSTTQSNYEDISRVGSAGRTRHLPLNSSTSFGVVEPAARIYRERMDGAEIHHAAPIRIENSDEEQEPAPPLPPKPIAFSRSLCLQQQQQHIPSGGPNEVAENDWYAVPHALKMLEASGALPHASTSPSSVTEGSVSVINVSGKRVLASTQSMYDVPPWRKSGLSDHPTLDRHAPSSPSLQSAAAIVPSHHNHCRSRHLPASSRTGRSATLSTSKSSHCRAKSQPPPQKRDPVGERLEATATLPNSQWPAWRHKDSLKKNNQDCHNNNWRQGGTATATVGRTLKKELSWSVSQLKALFSRHKDSMTIDPSADESWLSSSKAQTLKATGDSSKVLPPPYRPPPCVDETRPENNNNNNNTSWTTTLKRHRRPLVTKCSSSNASQGSVSGGEESYV